MDERIKQELAGRAEQADVSGEARQRVMSGVGHRRPRWVLPALTAAAAVAATVVGVAVIPQPDVAPLPDPGRELTIDADEWRTEYWRDVQIDVPADWWFGGGPYETMGRPFACPAAQATVSPDGRALLPGEQRPAVGYVGRPVEQSDACQPVDAGAVPAEPYVWFDAPLEPRVVELGGGWTQETVDVNGSTITVATQDPVLRQRILGSATGGETCLANRDDLADPLETPQRNDADDLLLCAYASVGSREAWLTFAARLTEEQAGAFADAFGEAPSWSPAGRQCDLGGNSEWVVLEMRGATYVVRPEFYGCPHVSGGGKLAQLTPELVEPWVDSGVRAVLDSPTGGDIGDRFPLD